MKIKALAVTSALVLVVAGVIAFRLMSGPPASPKATMTFGQGGLEVKVTYSRPFKKGRLIFGEKSAGALVPFGQYWRLGANAATEITFASNVEFGGKPVSAGSYRLYAVPAATSWKLVLNSALGKFGAFEPDPAKDVTSVEIPVETAPTPVEQFTIAVSGDAPNTKLEFTWDTTVVRVPLAVK